MHAGMHVIGSKQVQPELSQSSNCRLFGYLGSPNKTVA
jgi:hypothetical protein